MSHIVFYYVKRNKKFEEEEDLHIFTSFSFYCNSIHYILLHFVTFSFCFIFITDSFYFCFCFVSVPFRLCLTLFEGTVSREKFSN